MPKVKVLLTLRPDEPWEVDADELPNLRAEGLLLKVLDDEPQPAADPDGVTDGDEPESAPPVTAPDYVPANVPDAGADEGA